MVSIAQAEAQQHICTIYCLYPIFYSYRPSVLPCTPSPLLASICQKMLSFDRQSTPSLSMLTSYLNDSHDILVTYLDMSNSLKVTLPLEYKGQMYMEDNSKVHLRTNV